MNDARAALRSLAIYAVSIPLALLLGYLLANPLDMQSFGFLGIVFLIISAPLILRFHYPLMLLAWNSGVLLFFLPGSMSLAYAAIVVSFAVSLSHHIMDKRFQSVSVPALTRPLLAMVAVVVGTMILRGGFGLRSLGGESLGGRYYIFLLLDILGYFALTTRTIPPDRVKWYVGLFLLGATASIISDLYGVLPGAFDFLFWFIPPSALDVPGVVVSRFGGIAAASLAVCLFMLARYGVRGLLTPGRKHLFVMFCAFGFVAMYGGFRSMFIALSMTFFFQFVIEGLWRTKWAVIFVVTLLLSAVVAAPFVNNLPLPIQRTLAVLPVKVDPQAKMDAEASSEWRLQMWRVAWPEVPQYLLLGKGYGLTARDYAMMTDRAITAFKAEDRGAFLAGDYHNGPLSVLIPFGLWGALVFLWFMGAGLRVLWRNYCFGRRELQSVNAYLLAVFITRFIMFLFVVGSFSTDMMSFTAFVGLSVALNGGVAQRPVQETVPQPEPVTARLQAAYSRRLGVG
jgi:O-antigen ligase